MDTSNERTFLRCVFVGQILEFHVSIQPVYCLRGLESRDELIFQGGCSVGWNLTSELVEGTWGPLHQSPLVSFENDDFGTVTVVVTISVTGSQGFEKLSKCEAIPNPSLKAPRASLVGRYE
jgi:hypothetical protein